jgi:hypothetical protein
MKKFSIVLFLLVGLILFTEARAERNVYIIAHRCNDLKKPEKALEQGVNGIEADLWHEDGQWHISHDGHSKQNLDEWLQLMSRLSNEYKGIKFILSQKLRMRIFSGRWQLACPNSKCYLLIRKMILRQLIHFIKPFRSNVDYMETESMPMFSELKITGKR